MYTYEQRIMAVKLYQKYGRRVALGSVKSRLRKSLSQNAAALWDVNNVTS